MGNVAVRIKVMPTSPEVDLDALKENLEGVLPGGVELRGFKEEPVAFGLKALMTIIVVGDAEGGTESVEKAFATVDNVESVQVVDLEKL